MSWVRWSNFTERVLIQTGQMPAHEVGIHIRKFKEAAAKLLKDTGADHVLYAVKSYGEDGALEKVEFYQQPMTDDEYEEVVLKPGVLVFALHARK